MTYTKRTTIDLPPEIWEALQPYLEEWSFTAIVKDALTLWLEHQKKEVEKDGKL